MNSETTYKNLAGLKKTTNYAIVNGDLTGSSSVLESSSTILNYECDVDTWLGLSTTDALRLQAYTYPGEFSHPEAIDGQGVLAHLKIEGLFSDISVNYQTTGNSTNWDTFPGGYRNTMDQLVTGFNVIISTNPDLAWCNDIQNWQYQQNHGFIPSFSALDLPYETANQNLQEYLAEHLQETPFTAVYGPLGTNEQHSYVSQNTLNSLPNVVLRNPVGHPFVLDSNSPNDGHFNMAKPNFKTLGDLTIENGSSFHVNSGTLLTHFAEPLDYLPPASHYEANTLGCGANVLIKSGGRMNIGGLDSSHTANLTFGKDSRLYVESGARLIIERGSKLIFEEGSYLHAAEDAEIILKEGAELQIKEESEMIADDPNVQLIGPNAVIEIEGNLTIPELSRLELTPTDGHMGYLRFIGEGIHLWGSAAQLIVEGINSNQKIIEVAQGSHLWNSHDFDKVTVRNGRIYMNEDAQIVMTANFRARDVSFSGNDALDNGGVHVFQNNDFRSCYFHNVSLHGDLAYLGSHKLRVQQSVFTGDQTRCIVNGMGYTIKDCNFIGTHGIRSDNLTVPSLIADCVLDGQAPYSDELRGVFDESNAELQIRDTQILNSGTSGIWKNLGMLSLSCNFVEGHQNGIVADGCLLNMTTFMGGGNNVVTNNINNIYLNFAEGIALNYGCNQFSDALEMNIYGSVYGECSESCNINTIIPMAGNSWVSSGVESGPISSEIQIHVYDNCGGGGLSFCEGELFTFEQFCETECLDGPLRDPWRPFNSIESTTAWKKPYLKTLIKSNELFDIDAELEIHESIINELYQVVINQNFNVHSADDQFWFPFIRQRMNSSVECLHLISPTPETFSEAEQKFIRVLGTYDDMELAWSTIANRNFNEMAKASVYQMKRDFDKAEIFLKKSIQCGSDEEVFQRTNRYFQQIHFTKERCELELADALHESVQNQVSLEEEGDNIFGVLPSHIETYNLVDFQICDEPQPLSEIVDFSIFPNPSNKALNVDLRSLTQVSELFIRDVAGRVLSSISITADQNTVIDVKSLPPGTYLIEVIHEAGKSTRKFIVN
ncbi:MAG: T9SS type A sorting domain-containing protein [Bacteroidota bacterium]